MHRGRVAAGCALCGAVLFGVGLGFHLLVPVLAPAVAAAYGDASLFRPWGGWTRAYMAAHPWLFGPPFCLAFLWARAKGGLPAGVAGGALFGLAVFAVGALPVYVLVFASVPLPAGVFAAWVSQALIQYTLAGAVAGWLFGRGPGVTSEGRQSLRSLGGAPES